MRFQKFYIAEMPWADVSTGKYDFEIEKDLWVTKLIQKLQSMTNEEDRIELLSAFDSLGFPIMLRKRLAIIDPDRKEQLLALFPTKIRERFKV